MTNDEIETRIIRLETQMSATHVLLNCVLPATVPTARHQVLAQFGQWCSAMEAQLDASDTPPAVATWQLEMLAKMYTSLEGALKLIEEYEAKQKTK